VTERINVARRLGTGEKTQKRENISQKKEWKREMFFWSEGREGPSPILKGQACKRVEKQKSKVSGT